MNIRPTRGVVFVFLVALSLWLRAGFYIGGLLVVAGVVAIIAGGINERHAFRVPPMRTATSHGSARPSPGPAPSASSVLSEAGSGVAQSYHIVVYKHRPRRGELVPREPAQCSSFGRSIPGSGGPRPSMGIDPTP